MRRISIFALGCVLAVTALAQQPPLKQSGGPTSNESRIRIVEPIEGAVLSGTDFNLVIQDQQFPSGTALSSDAQRDAVRPIYQLFVDNKDMGNVPMTNNVVAVHTTTFGPHKIVLLAKNGAGQVIDRKELNVTTQEGTASASSASTSSPAETTAPAAPVPSSSSMSSSTTSSQSTSPVVAAPQPAPAPSSSMATTADTTSASSDSLPKTASDFPAAALGGLALVASGVLLRRRG